MAFGELCGRQRATRVDHLIEIDRQQGRSGTHEDLAAISVIDLEYVRRNDVLPAMVLEIVAHEALACNNRAETLAGRGHDVNAAPRPASFAGTDDRFRPADANDAKLPRPQAVFDGNLRRRLGQPTRTNVSS